MSKNYRGIIHEGEFVLVPYRLTLPINTTTSTDLNYRSATPVRLNSPNLSIHGPIEPNGNNECSEGESHSSQFPTAIDGPTHCPHAIHNTEYASNGAHNGVPKRSTNEPSSPDLSVPSSILPTNDRDPVPKLIHEWSHTHSILCVLPAPTKNLLFCGTQDSKILVYDMINYTLKHEISCGTTTTSSVLCLSITADENFLFSAGSDSLVKVWDISKLNVPDYKAQYSHVIYSLVDIGDIFSITWCDALSTIFIGAQNASILWCYLPLKDYTNETSSSAKHVTIDRLPHFRYDKFFDSKGPGGSMNTLQSKHQLLRKYSSSSTGKDNSPKLLEVKNDDLIRFAHNGYVYCMDIFRCTPGTSTAFGNTYADTFQNILITCGGDGIVNIWGINQDPESKSLTISKLKSLENAESIFSMSVGEYLYVGMSDSTINVWDLTTFQLIRSFHFNSPDSSNDEVLSLGIYNDCIFKASNVGGLVKLTLKSPNPTESIEDGENLSLACKLSTVMISSTENDEDKVFESEDETGAVLAIKIFKDNSGTIYLLSGGDNALRLWDITNVGNSDPLDASPTAVSSAVCETTNIYSNEAMLRSLSKYISYKTISKFPTLYLEDSRQCAQFLSGLLISLGASQTELLPVNNCNPIVFSRFNRNKKDGDSQKAPPRVLWYAHYDVVDATNNEVNPWLTDPFVLNAHDGNLYARGVSDNKGPTLAAIYAVAELYQKEQLACDVVFIIEGEEECGSIGFQGAIQKNKALIGNIDWVMLSNSYWLDDDTPCLNYGLRGVINATVTITSEKPDRHSGVDGGVSKEPTMDLVQVLGQLIDPKSDEIQLENFHDDVLPLSKQEIELYQNIEESANNRNINNQDLRTLMAKWRNPSLTIHKIQVSGPNNNTVIPQIAKATISIRIVPNQDLEKVKQSLIDFFHERFENLASGNQLAINIFHEAEPWLGDPSNLLYKILSEKVKANWNQTPLFIREGGSIPSIRFLEKCFNAPAAQIPCGQASDNAHLKDEKLRIINLYKLRSILTDTLKELSN